MTSGLLSFPDTMMTLPIAQNILQDVSQECNGYSAVIAAALFLVCSGVSAGL